MNYIKNFFSELKTNHKFIFFAILTSFIFSALPCLYILTIFFEDKQDGFLFFIPFVIILIINIIAIKIFKYIPKITKFLTFILNSFIIVIIQMFCALFLLSFMTIANDMYMRDKPEFYEEVLTYYPKERVAHFPQHIPQNATNVEMDADMGSFHGGQTLMIKFDTDKNYIEKELKKYKFKSKETSQHYVFSTLTDNRRIRIDDFTFYVINGTLDRFGRNYGIAVNKTYDKIIYYYSNPD